MCQLYFAPILPNGQLHRVASIVSSSNMHFETLPTRPTFNRNCRPVVPRISGQNLTPRSSTTSLQPLLIHADAEEAESEDEVSLKFDNNYVANHGECSHLKQFRSNSPPSAVRRCQQTSQHQFSMHTLLSSSTTDEVSSTTYNFPSSTISFASSCTSSTGTRTTASPTLKNPNFQTLSPARPSVRAPLPRHNRALIWRPHESGSHGSIQTQNGVVISVIVFRRRLLRHYGDITMQCGLGTRLQITPTLSGWRVNTGAGREARKWHILPAAVIRKISTGTAIIIGGESFILRQIGMRFTIVREDASTTERSKCRHTSLDGLYGTQRKRLRNCSVDGSSHMGNTTQPGPESTVGMVLPIAPIDKNLQTRPFWFLSKHNVPDILPPLVMWTVLMTMRKPRSILSSSNDGSWAHG